MAPVPRFFLLVCYIIRKVLYARSSGAIREELADLQLRSTGFVNPDTALNTARFMAARVIATGMAVGYNYII
jgi:hypothetical protein